MKKLLIVLLAAAQLLALSSCSGKTPDKSAEESHETLSFKSYHYATEAAEDDGIDDDDYQGTDYIINTSSKKIHKSWCSSANRIKAKNKGAAKYDWAIEHGYTECKNCFK